MVLDKPIKTEKTLKGTMTTVYKFHYEDIFFFLGIYCINFCHWQNDQ